MNQAAQNSSSILPVRVIDLSLPIPVVRKLRCATTQSPTAGSDLRWSPVPTCWEHVCLRGKDAPAPSGRIGFCTWDGITASSAPRHGRGRRWYVVNATNPPPAVGHQSPHDRVRLRVTSRPKKPGRAGLLSACHLPRPLSSPQDYDNIHENATLVFLIRVSAIHSRFNATAPAVEIYIP